MGFWGYDKATTSRFYLSGNNNASHTSVEANKEQNVTWQLENTLTYDKTIGKHTFGVVLGQSALKYKGDYLKGNRWNLVNPDKPSIDYATGNIEYTYKTDGNGDYILIKMETKSYPLLLFSMAHQVLPVWNTQCRPCLHALVITTTNAI